MYTETFNTQDYQFGRIDYNLFYRGMIFNPKAVGPKIAYYDVVEFYTKNRPHMIK